MNRAAGGGLPKVGIAAVALLLAVVGPATAGEAPPEDAEEAVPEAPGEAAPELGWANEAELSLVSTGGNSQTDTLGLRASFVRAWPRSTLTLTGQGLRADSTDTTRNAIGPSPDDYAVEESSTSRVTAEHYSLAARYEAEISGTLFWHAGVRWERHELAGFRDRLSAASGVGHAWWDGEASRFRTDYALTYTSQTDLVPTPGLDDTFLGVKLSYDFWRRLTATTELGSSLVVDRNLDRSEDLRAEARNWLSVSISDHLAFKISLEVLYDDLPALGTLPLEFPPGTPTGDTVTFALEEIDTLLTTGLEITF